MKTLIIGGTFNPVHIGHLMLADEVRSAFGYGRVLFIPAYRPPHKTIESNSTAEQRLAMLRLATRDFPGAIVEDCELARGSVSYTIDTIEYILKNYDTEGAPGLVIGDDLVDGFSSWREPERIASSADLIVAHRLFRERQPFAYRHEYMDNFLLPLSSTDIRQRIMSGKPWRYLVPEAVYRYIDENHVYDRG
jgi:nicotinate-nucleotide adenylyltransferase